MLQRDTDVLRSLRRPKVRETDFHQVGAGIRVPPNSSHLSLSWGVDLGSVKKEISLGNRSVNWHGNRLLDCSFDDVEKQYGVPYYFIHRADLINALVSALHAHPNITLRMDTPVAGYDFDAPAVITSTEECLTADPMICADGIKSAVRSAINGRPIGPGDTGDVAYHIVVPAAPLLADPDMRHLVTNAWAVHWMGHAVDYPRRSGVLYNVIIDVTRTTERGDPIGLDEWRSEADNAHFVARFADWCPELRKLCALAGTYLKWRLADFAQLERSVHPTGRVALLGDACHPMMPYMAQGVAQAKEDAAAEDAAALAPALRCSRRTKRYASPGRPAEFRKPDFLSYSARRDRLFGHDAGLLSVEPIPKLPPTPHASIHKTLRTSGR
ncbi:hypothetical protein DFH09DRAFT_1472944 [Mycena vulgaris]|nr:hypothetical protein DFH09DRAFT_1472944 [Mycena vulgaris]